MFRFPKRLAPAALATLALAGGAAAVTAGSANAAASDCPVGSVCIFPGASFAGKPTTVFYSYGAHNLVNQTGVHRVFNNQYGGAIARTCTGYNGTGCQGILNANQYIDKNLTPINSIVLAP